jgi:hypothetical protein
MNAFRQLIESHQDVNYPKVVRNEAGVVLSRETTVAELERLLEMYRGLTQVDQRARLLRDSIDFWLRRYHGYAIEGSLGGHYRQVGVKAKKCDFEHVVPQKTIRDLLIRGRITINQAMNAPTCLLDKALHQQLKTAGWASKTPSIWFFFRRYADTFTAEFETYNGMPITDLQNWSLEDHYNHFGIQ